MAISSWFNGRPKTYPITPDKKQIHTLYKKRVKDDELVEIGYQTKEGWVLHEPEPTPKFVAEWFEKKGGLHLNSYYPGTYLRNGLEIITSNFPQELYKNETEVIGFISPETRFEILGDYYVYYDDFEHPATKKEYIL